ncbi:hypothetical protein TNCV_910481 [Trichonephila clavipes]|uniref:Uncharacterized protein n=1 Tax=Trichonephila clavipes TaxID=2585209 RepID=A0A8X6W3Y4_TRICX|nr:hypothetical protein TNCV_910481 [Trichonephila clavipes]
MAFKATADDRRTSCTLHEVLWTSIRHRQIDGMSNNIPIHLKKFRVEFRFPHRDVTVVRKFLCATMPAYLNLDFIEQRLAFIDMECARLAKIVRKEATKKKNSIPQEKPPSIVKD